MSGLGMMAGGLLAGMGSGLGQAADINQQNELEAAKQAKAIALENLRHGHNIENTKLSDSLATDRMVQQNDMNMDNFITKQGIQNTQAELQRAEERGYKDRVRRENNARSDGLLKDQEDKASKAAAQKQQKEIYEDHVERYYKLVDAKNKLLQQQVSDDGVVLQTDDSEAIADIDSQIKQLESVLTAQPELYNQYFSQKTPGQVTQTRIDSLVKKYGVNEGDVKRIINLDFSNDATIASLAKKYNLNDAGIKAQMGVIEATNRAGYAKIVKKAKELRTPAPDPDPTPDPVKSGTGGDNGQVLQDLNAKNTSGRGGRGLLYIPSSADEAKVSEFIKKSTLSDDDAAVNLYMKKLAKLKTGERSEQIKKWKADPRLSQNIISKVERLFTQAQNNR